MYVSGAILVFIAATAIYALQRYLIHREKLALSSRDKLTDQEIYERYYGNSALGKDSVLSVWHDIAKCLKIEPGLLRPTDEFGKIMGRNWLTNTVLEDLEQYAKMRMRVLNKSVNLCELKTVNDFVKAFA